MSKPTVSHTFRIVDEQEETVVVRRIIVDDVYVVIVRNKADESQGVPDNGCSACRGAVWCGHLDQAFSWLKATGVVHA